MVLVGGLVGVLGYAPLQVGGVVWEGRVAKSLTERRKAGRDEGRKERKGMETHT